jgi:hypothetical protein
MRERAQTRKLVATLGLLFVIAACLASAGASSVRRSADDRVCAWGASSITASFEDGRWVVSQPQTTGCTSRP